MQPPPSFRFGTAGWAYPHWNGVVYPKPRPRGFHPLEFLARYFDLVEIDSAFYRPLKPEIVRLWIQKTSHNPDFQFTTKLHRRFTHDRILQADEVAVFKAGLYPLLCAKKLGCVVMQFPWSFRFTSENREFFIRLRRTFHEFPLVAEMRHSSWMRDEALGTFIDYHVGFVNIDQPQYVKAMPPTAFVTSAAAYVRLHGRNHGDWIRAFDQPVERARRYDYYYSPGELREWQQRIEHIGAHARATYVIMNNDANGKAALNALQLQAMLQGGKRVAPANLYTARRRELPGFTADTPAQESLFPERLGPAAAAPRQAVA